MALAGQAPAILGIDMQIAISGPWSLATIVWFFACLLYCNVWICASIRIRAKALHAGVAEWQTRWLQVPVGFGP